MIGKPQVKRKLGHEVQIYVCRFNVILDPYISGCNTLKLFKHDLTGKGHEFSDLAGRHLESCKLIPEETISHIFFVPFSLKGYLTLTI